MRRTRPARMEVVQRGTEVDITFVAGRCRYPFRLDEIAAQGLESTLRGLRTVNERDGHFVPRVWDRDPWIAEGER